MKINKPILIDELINEKDKSQTCINGLWYIAKDIDCINVFELVKRLYHAYLVVIGKARVYRFKEDDIK